MVEKDSIKEAPSTLGQPASSEQSLTLQALQKEIDYHRQHDKNGSYFEKAIAFIHDVSSDSLAKLELDFKTETEKANSISREQVIKDVTADQKALRLQDTTDSVTSTVTNLLLATAGKKWSFLVTGIATALDTTHPNDSFGKQLMEGVYGFGLGYGTSRAVNYGWNMENKFLGKSLGYLAFPVMRGISHGTWPNEGYGERPDVDKLFSSSPDVSKPGTLPLPGQEVMPRSTQNHGSENPPSVQDSKPDTDQTQPSVNNDAYWKQFHS